MSAISESFGSTANLKETIMQVMREVMKSSKFVTKSNIYSVLQSKVDRDAFDKELETM